MFSYVYVGDLFLLVYEEKSWQILKFVILVASHFESKVCFQKWNLFLYKQAYIFRKKREKDKNEINNLKY